MSHIKVGKKSKTKGECPICGSPLTNLFGVIRCSISTCDYVDENDTHLEAAEQQILRNERARGERVGLLDRLPKLGLPRRGSSAAERTTRIMADPSQDPLEDGKVRET